MSSINNEISIINEGKSNVASSLIAKFGVPRENLLNDDGSLKRLSEWNLDGVSQYWADQKVSSTSNKETTPQVATITIGKENNLYRNEVLSDKSLSWGFPQGIDIDGNPALYGSILELSSTGVLTVLNDINISGRINNNNISAFLSSSSIASNTTSNTLIPTYKAVWDAITTRVPTTRTVNSKALSSNITLTGSDINVSSSNSNKIASVLNKEAYLEWGGKNQINSSSPIDFTLNPFLSGNKLAALTRSDVSLYREISTNGTSWVDWTNSDDDKKVFMGDNDYQSSNNLTTGGTLNTSASAASTGKMQVRISALCRKGDNIYAAFSLNKIILSMGASSYTGTDYDFFKLECGKNATDAKGTGATWTTIVNWTPVRGYPGFNTINFNRIQIGINSSDYNIIRFTFKGGCSCAKILGFGDYANYWRSNYIGLYGRPYTVDHNGVTTFMGNVTIPSTLVVNGYTKFNGGVTFGKNLAVDGSSTFTGGATIPGNLSVSGYTKFNGSVEFTKNINVLGKSTLSETQIGNSDTSSNLKVYGSINATNNITASAFYESSDKNLKEDITSISAIDLARDIQLKEFRFKADGIKRYGVIAQDLLEEGLDNLVSTKNNHLTVDYISLLCLKIAQLEEEIKKIKMKLL